MTLTMPPALEAAMREGLSAAIAKIHRRGWCDGTGGNFSCVLQHEPLQLLMAPSGVDKGSVGSEALIVVDASGQVLRGEGRASAETALHLTIIEETGAGAVLHTHSQAGTLLSQRIGRWLEAELLLEDLEMLKGLEGITTHQTAVALPVLPNDQNLERLSTAARPLLRDAPHGLLIAGHGLYAWGRDLATAHRHLEILEFLLEQRWRQLLLQPEDLRPQRVSGVSHVLLDIEGTTCPVSFVSDVLFPYAAAKLRTFVEQESRHSAVQCLLEELSRVWKSDQAAAAAGIQWREGGSLVPYLQFLMAEDRKLTPLKDLQGMIWQQGYRNGELHGALFADVAPALRRWHRQGLQLAVYSSGSVQAQQLLYGHSNAGDLRALFTMWFDTRIGQKQDSDSYNRIARSMQVAPERVLFISDSLQELQAASDVGMKGLASVREGRDASDQNCFEAVEDFSALQIKPIRQC